MGCYLFFHGVWVFKGIRIPIDDAVFSTITILKTSQSPCHMLCSHALNLH